MVSLNNGELKLEYDIYFQAQAVTLSVSQAFQLAKDKWENSKNKKNSNQQNNKEQTQIHTENKINNSETSFRKIQSAPQIDLLKGNQIRISDMSGYHIYTCTAHN